MAGEKLDLSRYEGRIDAAIKRITDGHGAMRVPADENDPDLVLADCKALLDEVRALRSTDCSVGRALALAVERDQAVLRAEKAEAKLAEIECHHGDSGDSCGMNLNEDYACASCYSLQKTRGDLFEDGMAVIKAENGRLRESLRELLVFVGLLHEGHSGGCGCPPVIWKAEEVLRG